MYKQNVIVNESLNNIKFTNFFVNLITLFVIRRRFLKLFSDSGYFIIEKLIIIYLFITIKFTVL